MNVFIRELARDRVGGEPDLASTKLVVEDNIGESIHVHWRNTRFEMSIDDYRTFADQVSRAAEELEDGDY